MIEQYMAESHTADFKGLLLALKLHTVGQIMVG